MLRVMAPLGRGSCQSFGLTEGVYATDMLKAIIRYSPAKSDRTPPPAALKGSHLPLHAGRLFSVPSAPAAIFPLNHCDPSGGPCRRPYTQER